VQTLVAVAVLLTAAVLSVVLRRRKPDAPAQAQGVVPHQVDRSDFDATQKKIGLSQFSPLRHVMRAKT